MVDLDKLAELEAKATPKEWEHRYGDNHHGIYFGPSEWNNICLNIGGRGDFGSEEQKTNAQLIAALRNSAREMIEELREYRKLKQDIDESMKQGTPFEGAVKKSFTEIPIEEMMDLFIDSLADQVVKHD